MSASASAFPPPEAFGLPAKFKQWRPDQLDALGLILDAPTRFVGLTMPTGSGKSLSYMGGMQLFTGKSIALTATKGLQDQISTDFPGMALDLRGQSNYPCKALVGDGELSHLAGGASDASCYHGPCHAGVTCTLKEAGCEYYDRIRLAQDRTTVTNYALYLAQKRYGQGLGSPDLLVLDEAHQAADELAAALTIKLDRWMAQAVGIETSPPGDSVTQARDWARYHQARLKKKMEGLAKPQSAGELKYRRRVRQVERSLDQMAGMELGNWIPDHTDSEWVFEVLNPAKYAEEYLFQGAKRVVLLSATLTEKTLQLLGIQEATIWECPSRFPLSRRPVTYVPTCRVDNRMKPSDWQQWATRIDQIRDQRLDRKGIVHTVSYRRKDVYIAATRHTTGVLSHSNAPGDVAKVVSQYRKSETPYMLVSPSLGTGWDFPHDQCRFQVISKLPFPDTRSKIMKARVELDPDYMPYLTCQALEQSVGRGMRDQTDWCETFIIDDHWRWFVGKYRKFMTKTFLDACRTSQTLPKPLSLTS